MNSFDRHSFRPATRPTDRFRSQEHRPLIHRRQCSFEPVATPEQDATYLAAIEAGDFDTVLRLMKKAARKADMIAQAAWLLRQAIAAGYRSVEDLFQADGELFEILADAWRRAHPAFR